MRKILFGLMIAAALPAAMAKPAAEANEPATPVIAHVGDICKATGGFGRVFGRGYGHVDASASDDWAPFGKLAIEAGAITAEASFRGAGDSLENDVALAEKFLKKLDHAVKAEKHFLHRETNGNAIRFSSGKEAGDGVVLELHQEQDVIVAICSGGQ
jgi:hypothetical protein